MRRSWRTGFNIPPRAAGFTPMVSLIVGAVGVAVNIREANGDMRVGILPWAVSLAMIGLAVCCLGVLSIHGPRPSLWTIVGAWWTTFALLGVAAFFLAIALGSAMGIDEEEAGLLTWPPFLGMAFGIVSMTPALLTLATAVTRERILPWFGTTALWFAAPVLPIVMISGGLAEGTAETVVVSTLLTLFFGAWIVLGFALLRTSAMRVNSSLIGP